MELKKQRDFLCRMTNHVLSEFCPFNDNFTYSLDDGHQNLLPTQARMHLMWLPMLHLVTPRANFIEVFAMDPQNLRLKTGSIELMS